MSADKGGFQNIYWENIYAIECSLIVEFVSEYLLVGDFHLENRAIRITVHEFSPFERVGRLENVLKYIRTAKSRGNDVGISSDGMLLL